MTEIIKEHYGTLSSFVVLRRTTISNSWHSRTPESLKILIAPQKQDFYFFATSPGPMKSCIFQEKFLVFAQNGRHVIPTRTKRIWCILNFLTPLLCIKNYFCCGGIQVLKVNEPWLVTSIGYIFRIYLIWPKWKSLLCSTQTICRKSMFIIW